MEKKTMGAFLAALRKANGMTQQEVADRLNISNKTVSKWERDEGCPEIMMLPVIAELYSVTVDEILRGERIFREENENRYVKDVKSEKQAKYIFEKAMTKFTNLSILSVALGFAAVFISYFADYITPYYDKTWIVILLAMLMILASVLIQIIGFNNLKPNFSTDDTGINEETANKGKKKAILRLCLTVILAVTAFIGCITYLGNEFPPFAMFLPGVLLGLIVASVIYHFVSKSLGVDGKVEYSPEYIAYRKKHIKVTAIIVSVVCVFSLVFPFVGELIDYWFIEENYCFTDGVGYQYETTDEAVNEYNKLKNYFYNGEPLYYILWGDEENLTYDIRNLEIEFDETEEGVFAVVSSSASATMPADPDYNPRQFGSLEEFEEFRYKYIWDQEIFNTSQLKKDITFDDSTHTVYWKPYGPRLYLAFDIMPVFVLIGSGISLVIIGISAIIWNKKKKKRLM